VRVHIYGPNVEMRFTKPKLDVALTYDRRVDEVFQKENPDLSRQTSQFHTGFESTESLVQRSLHSLI